MRRLLFVAMGLSCGMLLLAQTPVVRPPQRGLGFTPPLTLQEEELKSKISSILAGIGNSEEGISEVKHAELQAAVEEHFDYLTAQSEKMATDLQQQVARLVADLERRKKAREKLVNAEVGRLILESQRVSFSPVLGALLRSSPGRRAPSAEE